MSKSLKVITFEADFSGSKKCDFFEETNLKGCVQRDVSDLVFKKKIDPKFEDNEAVEL